jgi:hypothetical protein
MPLVEKTYYKVELKGDVTIEAGSEEDAIAKARDYFVKTGKGLAWSVSKVVVTVDQAA